MVSKIMTAVIIIIIIMYALGTTVLCLISPNLIMRFYYSFHSANG